VFIVSQFNYKGCVFEVEYENKGKYEFYGKLSLVSVSGNVLEIPDTYKGQSVKFVYVSDSDRVADSNNLFEYHEVGSTDSSFSSIEEIRIPASLHAMDINQYIFPNLNKVVVNSENKHFRIIDEHLLCTSDDSLIAYCGNEELDECVIPDSIEMIGIGAFAYTKIHKIIFPSSVSSVKLCCVDHSIFLQELDDIVEFAGTIHALKKMLTN